MIPARDALKDGEGRFDVMTLRVIPFARTEHSSALMRGAAISDTYLLRVTQQAWTSTFVGRPKIVGLS
jgi:hypothetical protein